MNRQIARLALVGLALLAALIVGTTYWQTWATARPAHRRRARDGLAADVRSEPRREQLRLDLAYPGRVRRLRAAAQPGHGRALRPRLEFQGRDDGGRARLRPLRDQFALRRQGLLHRVRAEGEELRRPGAGRGVRLGRLSAGLRALDQRRLLPDRPGDRADLDPERLQALRLLQGPAAGDAVVRALAERALRPAQPAVRPRPA